MEKMTALSGDGGEQRWRQRHIEGVRRVHHLLPSQRENVCPSLTEDVKNKQQKCPDRILYCMIWKREDHRTSDHEMYIALLKRSEAYKAQPYQYASSSKEILKAKAKPFPPCTNYGFNDHKPGDCRNYPECEICGSYDHSTLGQDCVI
ncbi:hypothetical protein Tco_0127962 [Tanacetum coccineum]